MHTCYECYVSYNNCNQTISFTPQCFFFYTHVVDINICICLFCKKCPSNFLSRNIILKYPYISFHPTVNVKICHNRYASK